MIRRLFFIAILLSAFFADAQTTPVVSITPVPTTTVCASVSTLTLNGSATNGPITAWLWSVTSDTGGAVTFIPNLTSPTVTVAFVTSGTYTFTLQATNSSGSGIQTQTITVLPTPTITITKGLISSTVCPTSPDTLVASGTVGATYSWISAGGFIAHNDTAIATNAALGVYTYYVTATLAGCNSVEDSTFVHVNAFSVTAASHTICAGQQTSLSALGGTFYTWTPSSTLSCSVCANPVASPTTTTIYTVTASNGGVCTATTTDTVFVNPSAAAFIVDTIITPGVPQVVNFINLSSNATGYIWNFGDNSSTLVQNGLGTETYTYNAAGNYTVTLIAFSPNGCNDTLLFPVVVVDIASLSMPNIFTPNGDGINDYFAPIAHGIKTFSCTIYDRWGIKIITIDNSNDSYWDGYTTSGIACTEGTYFYVMSATDINAKTYNLKGFLQLIK